MIARLSELDSAEKMVVFCKGGNALHALALLISAGFKKVKNLKGGINAWAREVDQGFVDLLKKRKVAKNRRKHAAL